MIAEALRRLRLVVAAPPPKPIERVEIGDRLVAGALPDCTWTVVYVRDVGEFRMISLRWRNSMIRRSESALRSSKEGWRRA